jgi:hypothetical protein
MHPGDFVIDRGQLLKVNEDKSLSPTIDITFSLWNYLNKQMLWSANAFGPGPRTEGILKHMAKEADEVRQDPTNLEEWVDLIILAFDGAWRSGHTANEIVEALEAKQQKLVLRKYPDWRLTTEDQAIEHDRSQEDAPGDFRIDYELDTGVQGVWHYERHGTRRQIFAEAKSEFNWIKGRLAQDGKVLKSLHVIEIIEKDLGACTSS